MRDGWNLAMIDVASGSDTRVLVKEVLKWDKDFTSPEFTKLKELFAEVADILQGKVSPSFKSDESFDVPVHL